MFTLALLLASVIFLAACNSEERKEYYDSGKLKSITTYRKNAKNDKDVKDGKYISFYENGNKKEEGFYKLNEREGPWKRWYCNGLLKKKEFYKAGEKEGTWLTWCENGRLKKETSYISGAINGVWKEWYCSGQLKNVGYYNAKINPSAMGLMTSFEEWQLTRRSSKKELPEGVWKEWYENGLLKMIRIYKLGRRKFVWVKWNENGKIKGMGYDLPVYDTGQYILP